MQNLSSFEGLPRCTWRKLWWGLAQGHLDFEGVPKGIWIPMPERKHGKAFLQEQEPGAIAAERSLVSSN